MRHTYYQQLVDHQGAHPARPGPFLCDGQRKAGGYCKQLFHIVSEHDVVFVGWLTGWVVVAQGGLSQRSRADQRQDIVIVVLQHASWACLLDWPWGTDAIEFSTD